MQRVPAENKMSSWSHCQSGARGRNKAGVVYLFAFGVASSGRRLRVAFKNLQMYRLILLSCCWKSANNWLHRLRASKREWRGDGGRRGVEEQTNAEMTISTSQIESLNHSNKALPPCFLLATFQSGNVFSLKCPDLLILFFVFVLFFWGGMEGKR